MPVLIDTAGVAREVPDDLVEAALGSGWTQESSAGRLSRVVDEVREDEYGGVGGAVVGGLAAFGRGISGGATDAAARFIGGDDAAIALEGYRDVNPGLSTGLEIGGALAPALLTGGTGALGALARATPAGAASVAGRAAGAAAGGGFRGALAAGAVEGGLQGVGAGVSELALSTDPLTLERAASVLSSNALFGAGVGGAVGGAAYSAERVLAKARTVIDDAMTRRAAKAKTVEEAIDTGDLEIIADDPRALKLAREAEVEAIEESRAPEREEFVSQLRAARDTDQATEPWSYSKGHEDPYVRGVGKEYLEADIKIRNLLKNERGLAENPSRALDALQRQDQAIESLLDHRKAAHETWYREWETARPRIRTEIQARDPNSAAWKAGERGPFTDSGIDAAVEREMVRRYGPDPNNPIIPSRLSSESEDGARMFDSLLAASERNAALQKRIVQLSRAPESERLAKIDDAMAALAMPRDPSIGQAISAIVPFAGPLGVAATTGARVLGVFRKSIDALVARTGSAVSAFAGVVGSATPYVPVVATKALQAVRYGARDDDEPDDLPSLFKRRSDEIKKLTEYDETGTPRVRPEVRAQLFERLKPIAAVDPVAADRLETAAVRRIEHISGLIPRQPDFGGLAMPDWQPSDMEMRAWARAVAAAEDPSGVEERATHGALSPEDVAAYWAVYPERAEDFKQSILAEMQTGKVALPFDRKLTLSMLVGQPLDPSLHPKVISVLQAQFPLEPGSAGGAQAPRAQPQFGSMSKLSDSAKTPAQERQS